MKKIIFGLLALSLLVGAASVLAQSDDLPSPGTLPDSPFYFLKTWKEAIQNFFTFGAENKAKQFLHLADVRLAEYQKMIEKGKTEIAQKTLDKYEKQLNHALQKIEELKNKGEDTAGISQKVEETVNKHIEILQRNLQKAPEAAKKGLQNAIENSSKVIEKAGGKTKKEKSCLNSGGTVTTTSCCQTTSDFPNTCPIGACGCSQDNSHEIKTCDCGEGKCFNGEKCVSILEMVSEEPIIPPENKQEEPPKPTCQNECSSAGQKKCTDNAYQTCGDFDNDTCLEWSSITNCASNAICQNGNCIQQKCSDGTLYSQCSSNKPFYCDNGNLINKCSTCGCLSDAICQDGVCIQKKTVAILIDKDTNSKIAKEIDQYSSDVQEELNVNVKLISEDWKINQIPDPQISGVKDKLKDLYKNNGLLGAVLIGNVPMAWFDSEGTLTGGQTGDYVSDYWYMNIDGTFQDTDGDGMFNWKMNYHLEQESLPEIWIGRIKPPVVGEEGINLLKSYFDRNHKYRTGKLPNNEKLLWLHTIALAEENTVTTGGDLEKWYKESGVYDSVNWSKVWKIENIDIVFDNSGDKEERLEKASQEYLNKLQNNQYEFVAYSGHGTESYQEYGISSEDIKSIKPKVYFGVFTSCSLGDYSSENYIGGWYLFAGNGLAMMMRTLPSLGSAPNIQDLYLLVNGGGLNQRKTFGEAFKYHVGHVSWQATTLLGDPTLKLRY